ncbi:MAG: PIG-L family deacetylase [Bryobacteraceae bacterium]
MTVPETAAPAKPPHQRATWPKALLVMAHPDDEYALAATTYRLTREIGGVADHVVVTNGEGGYRYAALAETVYGVAIAREPDGRANLPAIRKRETIDAGRILGIRNHHFLDQTDSGFAGRCADASCSDWDSVRVRTALADLLKRESYDFLFILLPREDAHGHHRAVALFVLEAVASLDEARRPVVLGVEAGRTEENSYPFAGLPDHPLTRPASLAPVFSFDRNKGFGHNIALSYQIIANWVIAEHKSQGLFQTDYGKHDAERFWAFGITPRAGERAGELARRILQPTADVASLCSSL